MNYGEFSQLKYRWGELLDRLTILELKIERLPDEFKPWNEYHRFKKASLEICENLTEIDSLKEKLKKINSVIWCLEKTVKDIDSRSLQEIGDCAIKIRGFNRERIGFINRINELMSSEYKELKFDHKSQ